MELLPVELEKATKKRRLESEDAALCRHELCKNLQNPPVYSQRRTRNNHEAKFDAHAQCPPTCTKCLSYGFNSQKEIPISAEEIKKQIPFICDHDGIYP
jgi:hypothetical protein